MRPHQLSVTAFGAFPQTVRLDFDALAEGGLFLLHGDTGAGKTTLLDAIGFALYGAVPGQRGRAKRLTSDHAPPGSRTEVVLELTVAGRRLRITRSPELQRPKLRGTGTTTEPARVLLEERVEDGWTTVSTRHGEAEAEIIRLVGMSAEQFHQVVLLPQGDFARFLRADAADRTALLERLFGTDRFRSVEDWLARRRRETAEELRALRQELAELLARIDQVAGDRADAGTEAGNAGAEAGSAGDEAGSEPGGAGDEAERPPQDLPWFDAVLARCRDEAATAQQGLLRRQREREQAQEALAATQALADRQRRRRDALAEQRRVEAEAAEVTALRQEWERANRAAEVASLLRNATLSQAQAERAGAGAARLRAAATTAGAAPDADTAALRERASRLRQRIGQLEALRALERRLHQDRDTAAAAERELTGLPQRQAPLRERLAAIPVDRGELERSRELAREAGRTATRERERAQAAREAAAAATQLRQHQRDQRRLRLEEQRARSVEQDRREELLRLREERISGMAAELAAGLVDGDPCPVCGSPEHPRPATAATEPVGRDAEERAEAEHLAAQERLRQTVERLAAATATAAAIAEQLERFGAGDDPEELDQRAGQAERHAAQLTEQAATADELERQLAALGEEETALREELAELDRLRAEVATRGQDAAERAATATVELAEQLDGAAELDDALAVARRAAAACDAAAEAVVAADHATEQALGAETAARQGARGVGFADAADAATAIREPAWRDRAQRRIEEHQADVTRVAALLREVEVALEPEADVVAATATREAAVANHDAVASDHARLAERVVALERLRPRFVAALRRLAPAEATAAVVRSLADLVAGQGANTLRMTLSAFVLAARLEEVAAVASDRLSRMSGGRFTLVHTDATRGRGRSGLGLLVRDAWTGLDRDTATLSGGETFLASLALALGLADVVTAEAGGARVDSLFIDEGFGTLDEETLEEVMDVLDGLREGGRLVGLVSHVAELRQRVPARVHVAKRPTGSTLTVHGVGG